MTEIVKVWLTAPTIAAMSGASATKVTKTCCPAACANLEREDAEREGLSHAVWVDRRCVTAPPINNNSAMASAMKVTNLPER